MIGHAARRDPVFGVVEKLRRLQARGVGDFRAGSHCTRARFPQGPAHGRETPSGGDVRGLRRVGRISDGRDAADWRRAEWLY